MIRRIAITPGEPAGIGPDILLSLSQQAQNHELVAIADPDMLQSRAALLGLSVQFRELNIEAPPRANQPGELVVDPIQLNAQVQAGKLNANNTDYVLATLDRAINLSQQERYHALVTGPVHKGIINEGQAKSQDFFQGHTEYLAKACDCDTVVMMLATRAMRVALVTTHLPLSKVPQAITATKLIRTIEILHRSLQTDFGKQSPRILVCGLNPHAGEGGHLGQEEIDIIIPALDTLRERGVNLIGPLPTDTLFTPKVLEQGDAVLAMYHDQGLPVLKYQGFGEAVNITLGLPIIRTSVDHGTALDLAGSGKAKASSLVAAIEAAASMAEIKFS